MAAGDIIVARQDTLDLVKTDTTKLTASLVKVSKIVTGSASDSTGTASYKTAISITGAGNCTGLRFEVSSIYGAQRNIPCRITIDNVVQPTFTLSKIPNQDISYSSLPCNFRFNVNFKIEFSVQAYNDGAAWQTVSATAVAAITLD